MSTFPTAQEDEDLRSGIESQYNVLRDGIETAYTAARRTLMNQYHADLRQNRLDKEAAMRAAGLNTDGSTPYGRPTG